MAAASFEGANTPRYRTSVGHAHSHCGAHGSVAKALFLLWVAVAAALGQCAVVGVLPCAGTP